MKKSVPYSEYELVPIMEEIIKGGGSCKLKVTGWSMTPTLRHLEDSVVLVSPKKRVPKENEIVFIRRTTGKHVLHRIRKIIDEEKFEMNGDAQQWTEIVEFDQIIGVAESIEKNNKSISCDDKKYKLYIKLWTRLKPIRPVILRFVNLVRKIRMIIC